MELYKRNLGGIPKKPTTNGEGDKRGPVVVLSMSLATLVEAKIRKKCTYKHSRTLLSRHPLIISGHSLIGSQLSKSRKYCLYNTCIYYFYIFNGHL